MKPEMVALRHIFPHLDLVESPSVVPGVSLLTVGGLTGEGERQLVGRAHYAIMWLAAKERGEDVPEAPL